MVSQQGYNNIYTKTVQFSVEETQIVIMLNRT